MKKIAITLFAVLLTTLIGHAQGQDTLPIVYGQEVIHHTYFTVGVDPRHRVPSWVMYRLTPQMAMDLDTDIPRKDAFRPDPMLSKEFQASDTDYRNSGFDRGHLCPAEDMDFNASAMLECFFYTNIAPQYASLNRGWWRRLENQTREWAMRDTIFVITGVICLDDASSIGKGVSVPQYFYKIIVNKDFSRAISFLAPNEDGCCKEDLSFGLRSIDDIEMISGYDFFSGMNVDVLESMYNSIEGF